MTDLVRSLSMLGMAFVAVIAVTLGMAGALVPDEGAIPGATTDAHGNPVTPALATPIPTLAGRPGIGGTLTVSGDREGSFALTREDISERYSLTGNDGRISFEGLPLEVAQLSYDGLEVFPEPEECEITPHDPDASIGVVQAKLVCTDLEDVRGNGMISVHGEIGLPVDLLAERTLPFSGGTLEAGPETWIIEEAHLFTWQMPAIAGAPQYNLELADRVTENRSPAIAQLNISYDVETHALTPVNVERIGEIAAIPEGACQIGRTELGMQNPRTTVIELTISCAEVDVPGLGSVPITGTVVVDELAWPEGTSG